MNFLAHFALSNHDPDLILGNYLGDFLKVGEEEQWSLAVQNGIAMHRKIDVFTDSHSTVKQLKRQFSDGRRRVAGIILDVTFDHLLLRNWEHYYPDTEPDEFIQYCYGILQRAQPKFPLRAKRFYHYLTTINLLASYRQLEGVVRALDQLSHRLRPPNRLAGTFTELQQLDSQLEAGFNDLFPDLMTFCERWIAENYNL